MKSKTFKICLHLITDDNKHIYKYFVDKKADNEHLSDVKKRLENKIQLWINCNGKNIKSYCYFETDPIEYGQPLFPDVGFKNAIMNATIIHEE